MQLLKHLTTDERKTMICQSVVKAQLLYKIYMLSPCKMNVSKLICICSECEASVASGVGDQSYLKEQKVIIRAAGYNSSKNVIYYDVISYKSICVLSTVECTPQKKPARVRKLAVKDPHNRTMLTAGQLPNDIFALYSNENNLVGYQWKNQIMNFKNEVIMRLEKIYPKASNPLEAISFSLITPSGAPASIINDESRALQFIIFKFRQE